MYSTGKVRVLSSVTIFLLLLLAVFLMSALAQDPTPPPGGDTPVAVPQATPDEADPPQDTTSDVVPTAVPEEVIVPTESAVPSAEAPLEVAPSSEAPAAEDTGTSVSDIVTDAADSGLTLVDASGDPLQMGTLDAAATLLTGDPYFTSGGVTYYFLPLGGRCGATPNCVVSATNTPIQDAINFAATHQPDPISWTDPYSGDPKEVHPIYVLGGVTYNERSCCRKALFRRLSQGS